MTGWPARSAMETEVRVIAAVAIVTGGVALLEFLARAAVRHRTAQLIRRVVEPSDDLTVGLPGMAVFPDLLRGRVAHVRAECALLRLPGLEVHDVGIAMSGLRLTRALGVGAGEGVLIGRLPAADVLAIAGVPGSLELSEGRMTVRWPADRKGLLSARVRLRPVLNGNRIRLAPTPLSVTLPPLPDGATLVAIDAHDDALGVIAAIDLPTLLST